MARKALGLAVVALGLIAVVYATPPASLWKRSARHAAAPTPAPVVKTRTTQAFAAYAKLPLAFVPNAGQVDSRVRYHAQAGGASFFFTPRETVVSLTRKRQGLTLRLGFLGADPAARIDGKRPGGGRVNYFLGDDPSRWRTRLPTYGELVYRDLWPGIDLHLRGRDGRLEYEFHVAPGAKVRAIRLAYRGVSGLALDGNANLALRTPLGTLRDARPVSYQQIAGKRLPVQSRFALAGAGNAFGFAVGDYDRRLPLVIDPGLVYSTYLGGSNVDGGSAIAVDAHGRAYVAGFSFSSDFPTTAGGFDTGFNSAEDVFVTRLNAAGSALDFSTYLGGSGQDGGDGIAVDADGNAFVSGRSLSSDFPTTAGAFDTSFNGVGDAFVTKLNATGSALVYSTYLGGSSADIGSAIAVDAGGSAYVTGPARSSDFPTTAGAFDTSFNGGVSDAFATKLNPTGSALAYSTYLGGSDFDEGHGIAVDAGGSAYVTGPARSSDFPTTAGAFDTSFNGVGDAFVTKLQPHGCALAYSTYLGGSGDDNGRDIAVAHRSAYVTGATASIDFPTTAGALDTSYNGNVDAFVTKLQPHGSALAYSTYLGGSEADNGIVGMGTGTGTEVGIAVDGHGSTYVTGNTGSTDFPVTHGAFDTSFNGGLTDAFVTKLQPHGSALAYSTYLGGSAFDTGSGLAVDAKGGTYVTGGTQSTAFPTTAGAFDTSFNGFEDAFVSKLDTAPPIRGLSSSLTAMRERSPTIRTGRSLTTALGNRPRGYSHVPLRS